MSKTKEYSSDAQQKDCWAKALKLSNSLNTIQTAPHIGLLAKACYFWEMNWSIYVNEHISAIRMKSPCVIVHKQDSHNA